MKQGAKFLLLCYLACFVAGGLATTVNVVDHGAVGDGKTDDAKVTRNTTHTINLFWVYNFFC